MTKKVAVLAVNPVNGSGLFQYLEAFFENGIPYTVFAVADTKDIVSNSGLPIQTHDVVGNLKGKEDEFDALVFACGDAIPTFNENAYASYNQDMMSIISAFGQKGKILVGHCAGAMMFNFAGATDGKRVAVHPLAKPAVDKAIATDSDHEVDGNIYTAQTENAIGNMIDKVVEALK